MRKLGTWSGARQLSLGLLLGVTLAAVGGLAYASIPDPGGAIHGCFNPNGVDRGGAVLKIIDGDSTSCGDSQESITWNQTGLAGPTGATGATGPSGTSAGFAASNSQDLTADAPATEPVVGVSGLPAGSYVVWATIFTHLGDDVVCDLTHGTTPIQPGAPIHYRTGNNMTMTSFVRNAGANASFFVRCGQTGGDPEVFANIEVIEVDTLG